MGATFSRFLFSFSYILKLFLSIDAFLLELAFVDDLEISLDVLVHPDEEGWVLLLECTA